MVGGLLVTFYLTATYKWVPTLDPKVRLMWSLALNGDVRFFGMHSVVPMVLGSAIAMLIGSLLTPPPSKATIQKYFPEGEKI